VRYRILGNSTCKGPNIYSLVPLFALASRNIEASTSAGYSTKQTTRFRPLTSDIHTSFNYFSNYNCAVLLKRDQMVPDQCYSSAAAGSKNILDQRMAILPPTKHFAKMRRMISLYVLMIRPWATALRTVLYVLHVNVSPRNDPNCLEEIKL